MIPAIDDGINRAEEMTIETIQIKTNENLMKKQKKKRVVIEINEIRRIYSVRRKDTKGISLRYK
jgi:hypothetical protein